MTELLALGASHKTAPLALRERLAVSDAQSQRLLRELVEHDAISEAVVISTCNRIELYLVVSDAVEAESAVLAMLARRAGIRPTELVDHIYSLRNCDAARHLFRVTAGLDSMVVGEAEIQGQVKRFYEMALEHQTAGPLTNRLFRGALAAGKRARTETRISVGHASVASVAVDLARETLVELEDRHVLIVGAGETAELTARALYDRGVTKMFVANRHRERAIALAERFGGSTISFDSLLTQLERADIVLSSTASPHYLIDAVELGEVVQKRRGRPLLLIDLAVPRDIDPDCVQLDGVSLYDMDGLQAQVDSHKLVRRAEARKAEGLIEEEIQSFAGWLGSLEVLPTIAALRQHAADVAQGVLADNANRWESLTENDDKRLTAVADTIVKRLLHEPTARLRQLDADHRHARLQLLRELFGLDDVVAEESTERPSAEVRSLRPRGS
ncbi:MAG: glutamyl-tRNA reductase [Actinomycetota bacterium]|nr:glutamyl-tRNA reductase [Actinomycetota bacterium]